MQDSSYFQNNLYISMDTSVSTKQEFQPYLSNPFQLGGFQQINVQNRRVWQKISWSNKQKLKYSIFICYFRDFFNNLSFQTLNWNVFKAMSKFINSRNPQQCRSYHLKLINKFKGTKMFLKVSIKRIKGIREKLIDAQAELQAIQQEFEMYVEKLHENKSIRMNSNLILSMSSNKLVNNKCIQISEQQMNKIQKDHQMMKTADDYPIQQNPVNNNNNTTKINSDTLRLQEQNKPYTYYTMLNRQKHMMKSSLPSFDGHTDKMNGILQNDEVKSGKQKKFLEKFECYHGCNRGQEKIGNLSQKGFVNLSEQMKEINNIEQQQSAKNIINEKKDQTTQKLG